MSGKRARKERALLKQEQNKPIKAARDAKFKINSPLIKQFLEAKGLKKAKPRDFVLLRMSADVPNSLEIVTCGAVYDVRNWEKEFIDKHAKSLPKTVHRRNLWRYVGHQIGKKFWRLGMAREPDDVDGINIG